MDTARQFAIVVMVNYGYAYFRDGDYLRAFDLSYGAFMLALVILARNLTDALLERRRRNAGGE